MTLGESIQSLIEQQAKTQDALAMEWLELWNRDASRALAHTTVPSRLSELLADKDKGVRFFFKSERRAALLRQVLHAGPQDWAAITDQAQRVLAGEAPDVRVVVDITAWSASNGTLPAVFDWVKELLREADRWPARLVLRDDQYDQAPRSLDDLNRLFDYERAQDDAETVASIRQWVEDGAVYVGPRPLAPLSRWIDAATDGKRVVVSPADWKERLERDGCVYTHPDAEELLFEPPSDMPAVTAPDAVPSTPSTPTEAILRASRRSRMARAGQRIPHTSDQRTVRQTIEQLADPEQADQLGKPEARLALARKLGVRAVRSTQEIEQERAKQREAELRSLTRELDPTDATTETLEFYLQAVAATGEPAPALRCGDQIHLINPDGPTPTSDAVTIHRVDASTTAFGRLRKAVAQWTTDDWMDDHRLDGLVAAELRRGTDPFEILHARLTLLNDDRLPARSPTWEPDWREALPRFLAQPAPPAGHLDELSTPPQPGSLPKLDAYWTLPAPGASAQGLPEGLPHPPARAAQAIPCGAHADLVEALRVYPDQLSLQECLDRISSSDAAMWRHTLLSGDSSPFVLPRPGADTPAETAWIAAYRASRAMVQLHRSVGRPVQHQRSLRHLTSRPSALGATRHDDPTGTGIAQVWLALRHGLAGGRAEVAADGSVLLQIAAGQLARLRLRRRGGEDDDVRAFVRRTHNDAPKDLMVQGAGWWMDVQFETAALLGDPVWPAKA